MTHRFARPLALGLALALTAAAPLASAERAPKPGSVQAVRATVESAMTVTGTIDVDAAGNVVAWSLDQPDKLPAGVVKMAGDDIPTWTFEPVTLPEGKPVSRMRMSMLFVAQEVARNEHRIALRYPSFAPLDPGPQAVLTSGARGLSYPVRAAQFGVTGTVFLIVRIDRSGKVVDALVEQVNLGVVDTASNMERWRKSLGDAALRGTKAMQFDVPDGAIADGRDTVVGRLPIMFLLESSTPRGYGRWSTYVPGPRASIPWPEAADFVDSAPDALAPNQLQPSDADVRRLKGPPAG